MSNAPASKEIIEMYLMEQFHWTPKQIGEISYKQIQKIFLIVNQKNSVERINASRRQMESQSKGGKFYRDL